MFCKQKGVDFNSLNQLEVEKAKTELLQLQKDKSDLAISLQHDIEQRYNEGLYDTLRIYLRWFSLPFVTNFG